MWDNNPHKITTNTSIIGDRNDRSELESMNKALKASLGEKSQYRSEHTVENHSKLHDSTPRRF